MAHCNNIFAVEMKGNNEECFPIIEKILNEVLNNVCKKILIFSLDYDRCSNCKSKLTNSRMKFNDFYEKKAGRKEKYVENNKKTCELFDKHIFSICKQHQDYDKFCVTGSYRQDYEIDEFNCKYGNDFYRSYESYFKAYMGYSLLGNEIEGMTTVPNGEMWKISNSLGLDFWPILYADGDLPDGIASFDKSLSVLNNPPKKLLDANNKPIDIKYSMNKKALILSQFAKAENRWPGANIKIVFYDDKIEYLKSVSELKLRSNWELTTVHFNSGSTYKGIVSELPKNVTFSKM